jgi:hypothetical protein
MPRKPKDIMSPDQMETMQEAKTGSRIYKIESDEHKKEEIAQIVTEAGNRLRQIVGKKLELTKAPVDAVAEQVDAYLQACAATGTIPSFENLAHAFGYSARGVYSYLTNNPHAENAEFLQIVREEMASVIDNAAMMNHLAPAPAIFVLKSIYERREQIELVASQNQNQQSENDFDADAIRARYMLE